MIVGSCIVSNLSNASYGKHVKYHFNDGYRYLLAILLGHSAVRAPPATTVPSYEARDYGMTRCLSASPGRCDDGVESLSQGRVISLVGGFFNGCGKVGMSRARRSLSLYRRHERTSWEKRGGGVDAEEGRAF